MDSSFVLIRLIKFYNYLFHDSYFSQFQTTTLHKTQDSDTHYTFQQHQKQEEELEELDELSQDEEQEEEEEVQEEQSLEEIYVQPKGANEIETELGQSDLLVSHQL